MSNNSLVLIKRNIFKCIVLVLGLIFFGTANAQPVSKKKMPKSESFNVKTTAYLFAYFIGNKDDEEAIRFAVSNNGYNFRALNNNKPILNSADISSTGGVRDPHILRGADGKTFYMVVTDMVSAKGWDSNRAMTLLKSSDLINWTSSNINSQKRFPGNEDLLRVWAPQTIYDSQKGKYMIYWSMKNGNNPDIIYYAYANKDFTDLETEPKQLFFSPTNGSCIDGDIIFKDGKYHLFFKTEGEGAGIKIAVSDKLTEGYILKDKYVQQTKYPVEGAGVFKLNNSNDYILMYDLYTKGKYQFTRTSDLENFSVIDNAVSMNFHPRHGTIMPITTSELARLESKWGTTKDILSSPEAKEVKKININVDDSKKQVHLPVKQGTNLSSFKPDFTKYAGVSVEPKTPQDFTKGAVKYTVTINGHPAETWSVTASVANNPVLNGLYADPDILYSEKESKYYIYPTSDGFDNWSGTYFKTFSSTDLVNWTDEGIILDLEKDVTWAKKNAWAPCILEKKVGGSYKYYFYFTAGQKIGVAVADSPKGPFVDSGKPLIDKYPTGVTGGQQIDPDVFTDPKTGKNYLYWGNNYMAVAEINDDMISIKEESVKVITPDKSFREGTTVFFRNGKYYFLWSEDDTRSENYKVRYGTSDSPTGKINIPENNLVISKDKEAGIYATGHNSIIQIPGKDEWYIVYHRFNYPNGIAMRRPAGFNREVCIDKMEFDAAGNIVTVKPTHEGIKPLKK
ncbi:family 43 glycosylhydrolase [Flavobacterium gilvum]|uniref:Beta-xylosidase n=1 Tax=Flavobacterium gilvum TaxID=1492737 RepID=A0AAC9I4P7_9FLAO|nr:family 43 glycosylhydrolase [Flavobacterium gilvum]AOW10809.1 beta-xylosidase [Flavobacterium gilvum]KFC59964.1 beta-xylosidase [Flavobacterium gilvum]